MMVGRLLYLLSYVKLPGAIVELRGCSCWQPKTPEVTNAPIHRAHPSRPAPAQPVAFLQVAIFDAAELVKTLFLLRRKKTSKENTII